MIKITCKCGRKISVPDHFAGLSGKCKGCGTRLVLPKREDYLASPQEIFISPLESTTTNGASDPFHFPPIIESVNSQQKVFKPRKVRLTRTLMVAGGLIIFVFLSVLIAAHNFFGPNYYALAPEALRSGNTDLAEKYYRLGLQQAIRDDRHFFIAVTHQGLASVEFEKKNWAEAEREAKVAFDEFLCPKNENLSSNDYNLIGCFHVMGYSQIIQGKYEEGLRNIEEADDINAKWTKGFNEPTASLDMAKTYRTVASLSHQAHLYHRAAERIKKAEELLQTPAFIYLKNSIFNVNLLREKSQIIREAGFLEPNPDDINLEATRMENAFYARERADRERHELSRE